MTEYMFVRFSQAGKRLNGNGTVRAFSSHKELLEYCVLKLLPWLQEKSQTCKLFGPGVRFQALPEAIEHLKRVVGVQDEMPAA